VGHGGRSGRRVAVRIGNTEWREWGAVMAADRVDPARLEGVARNAPRSRPRPGHADLAGMQKYGFTDARPVIDRASARETAARVALGQVARNFLREALGIEIVSHVVAIGDAGAPRDVLPGPGTLPGIDAIPGS